MLIASWILWGALLALAYIYVGYPLLIVLLARLWPQRRLRASGEYKVSVILSVYNDAHQLPRKVDSLLSMAGSEQIVEILIGSDGSTDSTVDVIESMNNPRVRVIPFMERRGKPSVLNDLIAQAQGEILLLTDSRQEFDPQFLNACLQNFADDRVGVVSGELILRAAPGSSTAAEGVGAYWKYEKLIRKAESRFRGVPGATGACYALRRSAYRPIPADTILDDVAIPMLVMQQGYRCLFEPAALAFDTPSQSPTQEAIRKRRTIAGAAQLVKLFPLWAIPGGHSLWFEFASHKLLRLASPLLLVVALLANLFLAPLPPYGVLLSIQLCCYAAALSGWVFQRAGQRSKLFAVPLMFVTLNLATIAALWDAVRSRYRVTWQKTVTT